MKFKGHGFKSHEGLNAGFNLINLIQFLNWNLSSVSPTYGVGYEIEPSFIERSVKRKMLFPIVYNDFQ